MAISHRRSINARAEGVRKKAINKPAAWHQCRNELPALSASGASANREANINGHVGGGGDKRDRIDVSVSKYVSE